MSSNLNATLSSNRDKNQLPNDVHKSLLFPLTKNDFKPTIIGESVNGLRNDRQSLFYSFQVKLSNNRNLRDFVSGLTGGVLATTTLHPLDVLKIRLAGLFNR